MVKNFLIVIKKSTTDAIKTASKRAIQKTAEATGDLIGNNIADKITSVSKRTPNNNEDDAELTTHKKDIYLQKTAINVNELMNELRLVLKKDDYFRNDQ